MRTFFKWIFYIIGAFLLFGVFIGMISGSNQYGGIKGMETFAADIILMLIGAGLIVIGGKIGSKSRH